MDNLAIAEGERPDNSKISVFENFVGSKSSRKSPRLVNYLRSDLPVVIKTYSDGIPSLITNTAESFYDLIYFKSLDD